MHPFFASRPLPARRLRPGAGSGASVESGFTRVEVIVSVLILAAVLVTGGVAFLSESKGTSSENSAAQSELRQALSYANAYYVEAGQTFSGIMTPGQLNSTLTQIDTGVSYVTNVPSPGGRTVAVQVDPTATPVGSVIGLSVYVPGPDDCWGIIQVKSPQRLGVAAQIFGLKRPGTYYFLAEKGAARWTNCNYLVLSRINIDAISTKGFPKAGH